MNSNFPEGMIHIETSFIKIQLPIEELRQSERNALAGLLGFSSARKEAFEELRGLKKFKKIRPKDVWAVCPYGNKHFPTEVEIFHNNHTKAGIAACQRIWDIIPDADASAAVHSVTGFCPRCKCTHSVSKQSVLVKMVVCGVSFSTMYEV